MQSMAKLYGAYFAYCRHMYIDPYNTRKRSTGHHNYVYIAKMAESLNTRLFQNWPQIEWIHVLTGWTSVEIWKWIIRTVKTICWIINGRYVIFFSFQYLSDFFSTMNISTSFPLAEADQILGRQYFCNTTCFIMIMLSKFQILLEILLKFQNWSRSIYKMRYWKALLEILMVHRL